MDSEWLLEFRLIDQWCNALSCNEHPLILGLLLAFRKVDMKSDTQLQHDILAELKWEPSIKADKIEVVVKDGVVTLCGHLGSYTERLKAEEAATRVSGVKALVVDLDVNLHIANQRTDAEIARSARNALDWMTTAVSNRVQIRVEGGCVTLTGAVDWQFQKVEAALAVRFLMGVTEVANLITIKPAMSLSAVQADIEAALVRRAKADAKKIQVSVSGSTITLTGTVDNWIERDTARDAAWGAPGVTSVIDNLDMGH